MTDHELATTGGLLAAGGLLCGAATAILAGWDLPATLFAALVGGAFGVVVGMLALGDGEGAAW